MEELKFYVYEWFNIDTNEVFYVGKGCKDRYKNKTKRNKKFLEYDETHNTDVRIVLSNLSEEKAFKKEKELYDYYKQIGQCSCNIAEAGIGGCHFVWNDDMKENWSINNPMKDQSQRERMSNTNPMKNPEIAKEVGKKHRSQIQIGENIFDAIYLASEKYNVSPTTIREWCVIGENPNGQKCNFLGERKTNKNARSVIFDGKWYPSVTDAAMSNGIKPVTLRQALYQHRACMGVECEYANQQPS